MGKKKQEQQTWITPETLTKVEERKQLKIKLDNCKTRASKQTTADNYSKKNQEVKKRAKKDRRDLIEKMAKEAEEAAGKRNMKALYDITRKLAGKYHRTSRPVKSKTGETLKTIEEQMQRWVEHFKELLNQPHQLIQSIYHQHQNF